MVLLKGVAIADSCLTVVGLACNNDFAVVCNFEVDNFTNQTLIHKKLELIHGEIPHPPRDIQPGVRLKFGSRKGSFTWFGVGAICTWEFKNRLIVVFWQVPLSGVGGDNILGLAITFPGITHSDISLDRIQCGSNTYAFENYCEGVTNKTADGKIFKTSYFRELRVQPNGLKSKTKTSLLEALWEHQNFAKLMLKLSHIMIMILQTKSKTKLRSRRKDGRQHDRTITSIYLFKLRLIIFVLQSIILQGQRIIEYALQQIYSPQQDA